MILGRILPDRFYPVFHPANRLTESLDSNMCHELMLPCIQWESIFRWHIFVEVGFICVLRVYDKSGQTRMISINAPGPHSRFCICYQSSNGTWILQNNSVIHHMFFSALLGPDASTTNKCGKLTALCCATVDIDLS